MGKKNRHRKGRHRYKFRVSDIITIVIASLGVGMLLAVIVPFWIWIIGVGGALLIYALYKYLNI